ncbi:hypothetical protein [Kitasatospora sp. NPDC098663]|uniref:hypothetical protein n=1 Tax=Kitasatospora sp. NPDC098663 TaxID=3364096 RepID=UPI003823C4F7
MTAPTERVLGDDAAATVARTGIPVLLLADQPAPATITAAIGGEPRRYTSTTVTYPDGARGEVHAPGGPGPDDLVRRALPGAARVTSAYLVVPGQLTPGFEVRHNGFLARAGAWHGWTLLTVTPDPRYYGGLPTLRLALADGDAHFLSETIRDFARYRESWWIFDRAGWWEVTRADVAAGLDLMEANMRLADQAVRRTGRV